MCKHFLKHTFHTICITLTVVLIFFNCYKYYLDEDLAIVQFHKFHSSKDRLYPAMTLCFGVEAVSGKGNYTEDDLQRTTNEGHRVKRNILKPQLYHAGSPAHVLEVEKYISKIAVKDFHGGILEYSNGAMDNNTKERKLAVNVVFRKYEGSCFAVGIPFLKGNEIESITVKMRKSIFVNGEVPTNHRMATGTTAFSVGLSYQKKYFPLMEDNADPKHIVENEEKKCYGISINVYGMEVIHQRSKPGRRCTDFKEGDGSQELDDLSDKIVCKPQHWNSNSGQPDCTEQQLFDHRQQLDEGLFQTNEKQKNEACKILYDLWHDYQYDETLDSCNEGRDTFDITIKYNNVLLKEIVIVQGYDSWSLISNIGGCIGLMLGYSILQLPFLLKRFVKNCKHLLSHPPTSEHDANPDAENVPLTDVHTQLISM